MRAARIAGLVLGLLLGIAAGQDVAATQERIRALREEAAKLERSLPPAAQCTGVTKLNKRCLRKTRTKDGRCYQHRQAVEKKGQVSL